MPRSLRLPTAKDHLQVWTSKIDSFNLADVNCEAAAYLDRLIEVSPASGEKRSP
jgi:hypothetical protein